MFVSVRDAECPLPPHIVDSLSNTQMEYFQMVYWIDNGRLNNLFYWTPSPSSQNSAFKKLSGQNLEKDNLALTIIKSV